MEADTNLNFQERDAKSKLCLDLIIASIFATSIFDRYYEDRIRLLALPTNCVSNFALA